MYNASVVGDGPRPLSFTFKDDTVSITYGSVGTDLVLKPPYLGFELRTTTCTCGGDSSTDRACAVAWHPAVVIANTTTAVTLALKATPSSASIDAVRYAAADMPCPNMGCAAYNSNGLPGVPFVAYANSSTAQ